jgi:hypothetical protein
VTLTDAVMTKRRDYYWFVYLRDEVDEGTALTTQADFPARVNTIGRPCASAGREWPEVQ